MASYIQRVGDWKCGGCGHMVFASKNRCFKCGKSKGDDGVAGVSDYRALDSGDWNCEKCQHSNFRKRQVCRRCNTPKGSTGAPPARNIGFELGDWLCSKCGKHNFKKRTKCRAEDCDGEKPKPRGSDDDCVVCLAEPKEYMIVPCGHIAMCGVCIRAISTCPICRQAYNPDSECDIKKAYFV